MKLFNHQFEKYILIKCAQEVNTLEVIDDMMPNEKEISKKKHKYQVDSIGKILEGIFYFYFFLFSGTFFSALDLTLHDWVRGLFCMLLWHLESMPVVVHCILIACAPDSTSQEILKILRGTLSLSTVCLQISAQFVLRRSLAILVKRMSLLVSLVLLGCTELRLQQKLRDQQGLPQWHSG